MGSMEILAERHRLEGERAVARSNSILQTAAQAASRGGPVRLRTGTVLDLVGLVRGASYLVSGEPGAGKSTLLAQAAGWVDGSVYLTCEESAEQLADRCKRLGYGQQLLAAPSSLRSGLDAALAAQSGLVIVDSVSAWRGQRPMAAGEEAVDYARLSGATVVLVCHETKAGLPAGPRALEHLVDGYIRLGRVEPRALLAVKHRFGPAPLLWKVRMTAQGIVGDFS